MRIDTKLYQLFPVDMMRVVLGLDHDRIAKNCIEWIDKHKHYTSYFDHEYNQRWFSQMPQRDRFIDSIYEASNEFLEKTGRTPYKARAEMRLHAWVSVYKKGISHKEHIHRRSILSGTYYPKADPSSAPLEFNNPWRPFTMHENVEERRLSHIVHAKTGDMHLWPSWLSHRVPSQQTDEIRIAISFNID